MSKCSQLLNSINEELYPDDPKSVEDYIKTYDTIDSRISGDKVVFNHKNPKISKFIKNAEFDMNSRRIKLELDDSILNDASLDDIKSFSNVFPAISPFINNLNRYLDRLGK